HATRPSRRVPSDTGRHVRPGAGQGIRTADHRSMAGARGSRDSVTSILLVRAGAVAARTTRQLLDTHCSDCVPVLTRDSERRAELVEASANGGTRVQRASEDDPLRDVAAVVLAGPGTHAVRLAAVAVERSRPVVAGADDEKTMSSLLEL